MPRKKSRRLLIAGVTALLLAAGSASTLFRTTPVRADAEDWRSAAVVKRSFRLGVRRIGVLKPVHEQRIYSKVAGAILEMAPQGKIVAKDELVLKIDAAPHEDIKTLQVAEMAENKAEFKKLQQESGKILNQAKEDVNSYDLKVELEQMRLDELKKGAAATEVINVKVNLQNAMSLLTAKEEELSVLESLAAAGFASQEELRQKKLDVTEQRLSVAMAEIKFKKLDVLDPVKLAEQQLKVSDAIKTRDAAKERVTLLERNTLRDLDRYTRRVERDTDRLADLNKNIANTVHLAPGPGVVVHRRHRWYGFAPGRQVWDGQEVMGLPDFTKMKVALTVDEGRIGRVSVGQPAEIVPAGWTGQPFIGKVIMVADKGRDEFESYQEETTSITGTANRQVFDVEVEIQGQNPTLRPGLRASVEIILKSLDNVIVVPRTALALDPDGSTIVRVVRSGSAEARKVKVISENDMNAVVEGVNENERVWVVEPE
jgi:HlyD family secretion protein